MSLVQQLPYLRFSRRVGSDERKEWFGSLWPRGLKKRVGLVDILPEDIDDGSSTT